MRATKRTRPKNKYKTGLAHYQHKAKDVTWLNKDIQVWKNSNSNSNSNDNEGQVDSNALGGTINRPASTEHKSQTIIQNTKNRPRRKQMSVKAIDWISINSPHDHNQIVTSSISSRHQDELEQESVESSRYYQEFRLDPSYSSKDDDLNYAISVLTSSIDFDDDADLYDKNYYDHSYSSSYSTAVYSQQDNSTDSIVSPFGYTCSMSDVFFESENDNDSSIYSTTAGDSVSLSQTINSNKTKDTLSTDDLSSNQSRIVGELATNEESDLITSNKMSQVSDMALQIDGYQEVTFSHLLDKLKQNFELTVLTLNRDPSTYDDGKKRNDDSALDSRETDEECRDDGEDIMTNYHFETATTARNQHTYTSTNTFRSTAQLEQLFEVVAARPALKELHLMNFFAIEELRQEEMELLCKVLLQDHPTLTAIHLQLTFSSCNGNKIPSILCQTLGSIPNLSSLNLYVNQSFDLSEVLVNTRTNLQQLRIHPLAKFQYTDEDTMKMMNALSRCSCTSFLSTSNRLRVLDLGKDATISKFGLRIMSYVLRENPNLEQLYFSFDTTNTNTAPDSRTTNSTRQSDVVKAGSQALNELCVALYCNKLLKVLVNHTAEKVVVGHLSVENLWFLFYKSHNTTIEKFHFFGEDRRNREIQRLLEPRQTPHALKLQQRPKNTKRQSGRTKQTQDQRQEQGIRDQDNGRSQRNKHLARTSTTEGKHKNSRVNNQQQRRRIEMEPQRQQKKPNWL